MTTISLRMPEDVIDDLKRIAPLLGFSGYQPLVRAYVGQGLRQDLARLDSSLDLPRFLDSLRAQGIEDAAITRAIEASKLDL